MPTTDEYINAIKERRANRKSLSLDFAMLPKEVDVEQIKAELSYGLPDEYMQAIKTRTGKIRLDFSVVPFKEPEKIQEKPTAKRIIKPEPILTTPEGAKEYGRQRRMGLIGGPTIGPSIGQAKFEYPIPPEEEIAFHAERLLKPDIEKAAKQPKTLRAIQAETFKKYGVPYPEFVSEFTDPATYAYGALLGPILKPVLKPIGALGMKTVKAIAKPFIERAERKTIGKAIMGQAPAKITSKEARAAIMGEPVPSAAILSGRPIVPIKPLILPGQPPAKILPIEVQPLLSPKPVGGNITALDKMVGASAESLTPSGTIDPFTARLQSELVDKYTSVYNLVRKAQEATGKVIKFDENPYNAARLYAGISGKIENRLNKLRDIIAPIRTDASNLERFMLSQRVIEREMRGFANPAGATARDAWKVQDGIAGLGPDRMTAISTAADKIRTVIGDDLLITLRNSGVLSTKMVFDIKKKNQFWTPFDVLSYVADNEGAVGMGRTSLSVNKQDVMKSLIGTNKKIRPAFEALVSRISKTISLAERNNVTRKLANLKGLGSEMDEFILTDVKSLPAGFKKVSYFDNGIKKEIGIPGSVADSITGMDAKNVDIITEWIGKPGASWLRTGATMLNIPFILISNPIRDFQTVAITTGKGIGFVPWWIKGFAEAFRQGEDFRAYREFGGYGSGFISHYNPSAKRTVRAISESKTAKFAKTILNPVELIKAAGTILEMAPRLGVYKLALKRGVSQSEAALLSRNATVDFARSGNIMKLYNMWVPFINARLQGSIILGKSFIKNKPTTSIFNMATIIGVPAAATYEYNRRFFPKLYDQIPDYEKENYFIIIRGEKKDSEGNLAPEYIRIPKGDIGRIFGNPIEAYLDWRYKTGRPINGPGAYLFNWGDVSKAVGAIALKTASAISPIDFEREGKIDVSRAIGGVLPPFIKAPAEVSLGKSFYYGADIIPGYLKDVKTKSLQYTKRTPKTLVWLGKQTGLSPIKLQHFLKTLFAGGSVQVLEPHKIPQQLREKVIQIKGGKEATDIYSFKEELRGEKADIRVSINHALIKIISGTPQEQKEGQLEIEKILSQVLANKRKKFLKFQRKKILGKELPLAERALRSMSKQDRAEYLTNKYIEEVLKNE